MGDTETGSADAIVVLGCRVGGVPGPGSAAGRRVRRARDAYVATGAPLVVVSGGRRWDGVAEATALAEALIALGVPASSVVRELCSLSTLENAAYSSEILRARGATRPLVVTCDWHAPRAMRCFRLMGVDVRPFVAPSPPARLAARLGRGAAERVRLAFDERAARGWAPS